MTKAIQYNENQNHSNISIYKQKAQQIFLYTPTNYKEMMEYCVMVSKSAICPKNYQNKPEDIFVATQFGAEVGLKFMQSLHSICVINGRPTIWGDSALALVQSHPFCEWIKEYYDEKSKTYFSIAKRKGHDEHVKSFSEEDARRAKLWNKPGPWQDYPIRMLQVRARGFVLRDKFPDVLRGIIFAEEAQDYSIDVTPTFYQKPEPVHLEQTPATQKPDQTIIDTDIVDDDVTHEQDESKEIQATLVEYISMYNVPTEVVEKWKVAAKQEDLYDFSDEQATSCIELIRKKYSSIDVE